MTITHRPRQLSATSLVGTSVRNPQNESIGDVKDLMIDLESGHVAYAVLSFGGFLGLGDKLFAVPFEAFRIDSEHEELVLDVKKDQLEKLEGFDEENWPNFADPEFHGRTHGVFRTTPRWTR